MDVKDWLAAGDAPEADWSRYLLRRANRGELGDGGEGLLLDLPALAQPYACRTGACTPGRRSRQARSCCADLDVPVEPSEQRALQAALPAIAALLSDDPRWQGAPPRWLDQGFLAHPGRRCVFAGQGPEGLWCALHRLEDARSLTRGSLKPMPCRLFPLALIDLGHAWLLTAVHRDTARSLDARPARVFPCLGASEAPALVVSEHETLTAWLGADGYDAVASTVADYQARQGHG